MPEIVPSIVILMKFLEAAFQRGLPIPSRACHTELSEFFTEWFDTAYPTASGATEPGITGPALDGPGFACQNASG